ncbi:hypothetical protein HDV06_005965 [Boothiomyces sp. JEL0866]|nr:hypothetical protein HDV06_005965 [Boothiomyces sp. JEL0866]
MIDLNINCSNRIKSDIREIEYLGELVTQLNLPLDVNTMEIFQRLVEVAGTKEFIPLLSSIQHYVLKLKWAREGTWNTGYIVPWMSLYSCLGGASQLVSIATHYTESITLSNVGFQDPDLCSTMGFKSPLIKAPVNVYGGGARPVEINKEEWNELLINGLNSTKKDMVFPIKKRFKTSIPQPEKKVEKKRDRKRATPYSKSKIINAMMDLEKIERVVNPISSPHFAASAGP